MVLAEHPDRQQTQGFCVFPVQVGGQSRAAIGNGQRVGGSIPCRRNGDFAPTAPVQACPSGTVISFIFFVVVYIF
jgi:hypothetical protein